MEKAPTSSQTDVTVLGTYRNQALDLLERQKTLVLAVSAGNRPWLAPVYYVYESPGIYFFSRPRSKHIQALRDCPLTAGAIYADSHRWQDIHGLQMIGQVEEVQGKLERLNITTRYLVKFPLARDMLASGTDRIRDLSPKVGLYVFWPTEIHCTNNSLEFGRRVQIKL
jgi:uncharacterized protein YhbP (UPF0306 family)